LVDELYELRTKMVGERGMVRIIVKVGRGGTEFYCSRDLTCSSVRFSWAAVMRALDLGSLTTAGTFKRELPVPIRQAKNN